jgi:hypothetical protein
MALTPYAESLREPLARALGGITRILEGADRFDPANAAKIRDGGTRFFRPARPECR